MIADMKIAKYTADANEYFDTAEAEPDLDRKLPHVKAGLELLDQFLARNPHVSDEEVELIRKIRRVFTQRLLVQFLSTREFRQETWIDYFELFTIRLHEEMSYITTMEPLLKAEYESYLCIWFSILRADLENEALTKTT